MRFRAGGTAELLRITSDGDVGINTTSPTAKLNVVTDSTDDAILMLEADMGTNNNRTLQFKSPATDSSTDPFLIQTANSIQFRIDSTDALKIHTDGKVGIGTADPAYLLHVLNSGFVGSTENDRKYNGRFTTRSGNRLNLDIYDRRWQDSQTHGWIGTEKRIEYNVDDNNSKRMWISFFNPNNTISDNIIRFGEQEDTEWMRIDNGNIGIGTDDPTAKLEIVESYTNRTWTPTSQTELLVERDGNCIISAIGSTISNCVFNFGDSDDENVGAIDYDHADDSMGFRVNGAERFNISSTGRITQIANNEDIDMDASASGQLKLDGNGYNASLALNTEGLNIYTNSANRGIIFGINEEERLRITSSGTIRQNAGAFSDNLTYGGRTFTVNHDILATSMRGGVLVRNGNDFRSETDAASFMVYDAYDTTAKSYAFRAARGATLSDTFWVKTDGSAYVGGAFNAASKAVSALQIDCSTGNFFTKSISGNSTFTFANVPSSGTAFSFTIEIDVTGSNTSITWPSSVKFNGGSAPTLTDTKTHLFMFVTHDGGTTFRGSALVNYTT